MSCEVLWDTKLRSAWQWEVEAAIGFATFGDHYLIGAT
jgi:hypothetical protein